MHLDSVGEVIATRRPSLVDEPNQEILVKIGKPQKTPENGWSCTLQVTGVGGASGSIASSASMFSSPLSLLYALSIHPSIY
jgi:hypothetical protein